MKEDIYNQICHLFEQYNYQVFPTDSEQVKMYGTFSGGCLYLINVIQLDEGYTYSKELFAYYKDITSRQFGHVNASKIILLNLLITKKPMEIYESINYMPDFDQDLIDIQWLIHQEESKLIIPKEQVKKVLGLERDLKRLLEVGEESITGPKTIYKDHKTPYITYSLMVINICFWILLEISGGSRNHEALIRYGAILSQTFFTGQEYYKLLTSMFLHIGLMHLLYNLFGLYIFGSRIELYMKPWKFLVIYIGAGLTGGMLSVAVDYLMGHATIAAGASGAIYGVMGALLVYTKIYRRHFEGLNTYIILLMIVVGFGMGIMTPGVGNLAHLGGLMGGALISLLLPKQKSA